MARQTFISKDFFVDASEYEAKQMILNIPDSISNIKFITENALLQSYKFIYERPIDERSNYINVSILPLNDQQTKVTLHGSNVNGRPFRRDSYVNNAVKNFESAIKAAVSGNMSACSLDEPSKQAAPKFFGLFSVVAGSAGIFYLLKFLFS